MFSKTKSNNYCVQLSDKKETKMIVDQNCEKLSCLSSTLLRNLHKIKF